MKANADVLVLFVFKHIVSDSVLKSKEAAGLNSVSWLAGVSAIFSYLPNCFYLLRSAHWVICVIAYRLVGTKNKG